MSKFYWKTEGSKCTVDVVHIPPLFTLLIVIGIAVAITMLLTGKLAQEEQQYKEEKARFDTAIRLRSAPKTSAQDHDLNERTSFSNRAAIPEARMSPRRSGAQP